jgi:hypothetical protein
MINSPRMGFHLTDELRIKNLLVPIAPIQIE